jgi:hypothetical protein
MNEACPQLNSLNMLFDDELPQEDRVSLIDHLRVCEICKGEFDQFQRIRTALNSMAIDPSARQRVLSSLPHATPIVLLSRRRVSVPWPVAAAILLLLAASVIGNAFLGLRSRSKEQNVQKAVQLVSNKPELFSAASGEGSRTTGAENLPAPLGKGETHTAGTTKERPVAKFSVITLETEHETMRFVTSTEYRPYSVPRIYIRTRIRPSDER